MAKSSYLCGKCERNGTFYCTHCDGTCNYVDKTWVMPDREYHKIRKDMYDTMNDAKKTFLDYVKFDNDMTKEVFNGMRFVNGHGIKIINDPREMIKDVIFNDPATIVYWADGTKTVVKAQEDEFDPEKGLAMAFSKKLFGNKGNYYNVFRQWLEPYWQKKAEEADEEIANLWRMLMDATTSVADKLNAYAMTMREENKNGEESIEDAAKEKYNPVEEAYMQINNFLNGKGSLDLDEIRGLLGEALE